MARQIKALILALIFTLASFSTYAAAAATTGYSKTLEQIYKSKNVYNDTEKRLSEFNKKYSDITYLFSAGKSVQKRDLTVLKIGSGPKKIFINAAHHPREYMGTILTLNQMQSILEAYASNSSIDGVKIRNLLDEQVTFYFMPLVNPDGVQICVNGSPSYYFNANRVDLNHNYDADWTKKITKSYSTGTKPFSEPETQAVQALCEKIEFDMTIAYHAAGDIIYWYYGQQGPDRTRDLNYANLIKKTTGYSLVSTSDYKSSTSGFKDWCVKKLKIPSFTLEIGGKQGLSKPLPWSAYSSVWQKNKVIPARIANQLLKQTRFQEDNQVALIYNHSLVRLKKSILSRNGINYIYTDDAKNLLAGKLTPSVQSYLRSSEIVVNRIPYFSIKSMSGYLKMAYRYEQPTNTVYLQ